MHPRRSDESLGKEPHVNTKNTLWTSYFALWEQNYDAPYIAPKHVDKRQERRLVETSEWKLDSFAATIPEHRRAKRAAWGQTGSSRSGRLKCASLKTDKERDCQGDSVSTPDPGGPGARKSDLAPGDHRAGKQSDDSGSIKATNHTDLDRLCHWTKPSRPELSVGGGLFRGRKALLRGSRRPLHYRAFTPSLSLSLIFSLAVFSPTAYSVFLYQYTLLHLVFS